MRFPSPPTSTPMTKKRKSYWESKFEKDYPYVKWTPHDLSVKFMIPLSVLKTLNKEDTIKYIYLKNRDNNFIL